MGAREMFSCITESLFGNGRKVTCKPIKEEYFNEKGELEYHREYDLITEQSKDVIIDGLTYTPKFTLDEKVTTTIKIKPTSKKPETSSSESDNGLYTKLMAFKKPQLIKILKDKSISGYSGKNKDKLSEMILENFTDKVIEGIIEEMKPGKTKSKSKSDTKSTGNIDNIKKLRIVDLKKIFSDNKDRVQGYSGKKKAWLVSKFDEIFEQDEIDAYLKQYIKIKPIKKSKPTCPLCKHKSVIDEGETYCAKCIVKQTKEADNGTENNKAKNKSMGYLIFSNEHCEFPDYLNYILQDSLNDNVKLISKLRSDLININIINDKYDYIDMKKDKLKLKGMRDQIIKGDPNHMLSKILNKIYYKK